MSITDLYGLLFGKEHIKDGDVISFSEHGRVGGVSTGQGFKHVAVVDPTSGESLTTNHLCTDNTTTTPLGANATFTGEWQDVINFQEVNVSIVASHNSATNGLVFQWSADGVNIGDTDVYSYYAANGGTNYTPNPAFRYFRMVYTNGATPQTSFSLQTILRRSVTGGSFHRIDSTLRDDQDARLQIVVPKLKTSANTYVSQTATTAGNAKVSIEEFETAVSTNDKTQLKVTQYNSSGVEGMMINPSYASAFGTFETAELTPIFQGDFVYGLNTQMWLPDTTSGTGATVDVNGSRLRIQSGTANNGHAYIQTRRNARYRAGQGTLVRFTPLYTTGLANSIQLWGMGTLASDAPYDGYFFGYNGVDFGIAHYIAGTPTWIKQTDWNGTAITWDKTKGSPVMIKYPYLGYGDIFFYVQNPTTGFWTLVHTIRYANTTNVVQLTNPSLHFIGYTKNSGNETNLTMYCGSIGIFVSGMRSFVGNPKWSFAHNKTGITAETAIMNIRNATSYNGIVNEGHLRLSSMAVSSSSANGIAIFRLRIGATLGGTPAYTTINGTTADNGVTITAGNSIASYDTAATTATGGTLIYSIAVDNPNSTFIDLVPYEIFVAPTEILTVSGFSSNASELAASLNWTEDI